MARYHNTWIISKYGKPCQQPLQRIAFTDSSALTVHKATVPVWNALAKVFDRFGYDVHPSYPEGDTGAYNCRTVTGGTSPSPHSWGIAADINWNTNPYRRTPDRRKVLWGYDTDMDPLMIQKVREITVASGQRAVWWGGDWSTIKDAMHFQVIVSPAEIATGIVLPSGIEKPPPMPEPDWKQPGDPVETVDDAMAALIYQGGADYWRSLIETGSEDAIYKTGVLADRAMVLDAAVTTCNIATKGLV